MARPGRRRRSRCLLLAVATFGWFVTPAYAAWSASGTGMGTATSASLAPPTNLVATCGTLLAASVTLTWSASASPWTVGYEVRQGTSPGNYTSSATTAALTYTATLTLGLGTYYFTVRTTTGAWRSTGAAEVSKTLVNILFVGTCQ
jgi:hypothetical protein